MPRRDLPAAPLGHLPVQARALLMRPHLVQSGGAIYLQGDDRDAPEIVSALQRTGGVGAIFTRAATPSSLDGVVAGTLSFEAVRWQHDRRRTLRLDITWRI